MSHAVPLEEARRMFAEELRVVAHVRSEEIVRAFATVPRERFVGPGPWRLLNSIDGYWTTPDDDPRWLCHNVLVALDESRGLNTGEPSLWAQHFDRIDVRAGDRVLQIGTGSGYFTAILAEIAGGEGSVLGLEVDGPLAEAASRNVAPWLHATIRKVDGVVPVGGPHDVLIGFAGVSAPPLGWLDALADGGRALIPLTNEQRFGLLLQVDRTAAGFAARSAGNIGIFPCAGARQAAEAEALGRALADHAGRAALKSLRRDQHQADETCWLHGDGWCLSKHELH
jgi:protein-L-isoaspartate(D-aspartate) O-methyltransferase